MKKSTKYNLLETGLALALMIGSGKLTLDNYRKFHHYSGLIHNLTEKNPNAERMYSLRRDLFFYFSDKSYDKLDRNPSEIATMGQEYASLISDEANKKDFEDYLKFQNAHNKYALFSFLSLFGAVTPPTLLLGSYLPNRKKKIKEDKK